MLILVCATIKCWTVISVMLAYCVSDVAYIRCCQQWTVLTPLWLYICMYIYTHTYTSMFGTHKCDWCAKKCAKVVAV